MKVRITKPNMVVTFVPIRLTMEVKLVKMHHELLLEHHPSDNINFNVKNVVIFFLKKKYFAYNSKNNIVKKVTDLHLQNHNN
jgi:translation elongation factor EF-1alpha